MESITKPKDDSGKEVVCVSSSVYFLAFVQLSFGWKLYCAPPYDTQAFAALAHIYF